ncbi:EAL domain-containing protein [Thalassotalea fusca]
MRLKKYQHCLKQINLCLVFILSCICIQASALTLNTNDALKFKHLSVEHGLSQNNVFSVTQDHKGFIWIGTENGLNRYDGYAFKQYRKNISLPNSLADNLVRKVFVDSKGTLWVGTNEGLSRYNEATDDFTNYFHSSANKASLVDNEIWDIYEANDDKKTLWVSTREGIHTFDRKEGTFVRKKLRGFEDNFKEIKTIFQDESKNYWLGSYANGITVVNENFSFASTLRGNNRWQLNLDVSALYDMVQIGKEYWLATDNGLYVLNKQLELIQHYNVNNTELSLLSNTIRGITLVDKVYVWVATKNGLNIINTFDGTVQSIKSQTNTKSISEDYIVDIFQDNTSKIWLGTWGKGLSVFSPKANLFQHRNFSNDLYTVDFFDQDNAGNIWFISQQSELNIFDETSLTATPVIKINDEIFQFKINSDNIVWIYAVTGNLHRYDIENNSLDTIENWYEHTNYNDLYPFVASGDYLWFINNDHQLVQFDVNNKSSNTFPETNNLKARNLYHDKENNELWIVTDNNRLVSIDLTTLTQEVHEYSIPESYAFTSVTSLNVSDNNIWLGSEQGVLLIERVNKQVTLFNNSDVVTSKNISSILVDESKAAWIAANNKVVHISPKDKRVVTYGQSFNLFDNEFISKSALISINNNIYLGGMNGFHYFDPAEVSKISQTINPPIIDKLFIANKEVPLVHYKDAEPMTANKFSLPVQLSYIGNLALKHEQSPFSIEFVSPNPEFLEQVGYRYKLAGLESSWIESGDENYRAHYTGLSAGHYTFYVQAFDKFDPSQFVEQSLEIQILPPWWLSNSAILIYTLTVLLILAYFLQQMRHKRLYHLQIKLSEERLKLSLWGSGDEMWDWNIKKSKIYRSNIWGILEFPQDGKRNVGSGEETNVHENDLPRIKQALEAHIDNETEHFEATYRVRDKNNNWIWVLDRGKIVERDDKDLPARMTGTLKDISQIKKADERLKLFAKCIENISDAVVIYDRQFNIVDVNKAFQRITGKPKRQMVGTQLKFSRYPEQFTLNVKKHLIQQGGWHGEIESQRDNGELYLTDLNIDIIKDESGNISHFVGVFSDITKRKETEAELRKLANSDTLTGLPNRSYFQANQFKLVKNKTPHALLVFDLDNFKKVNDSMGHEVGDVLLCKVAERIRSIGRKQDTVYRLGGDEFSIIIEDTNDIHTITSIAKSILRSIAQPLKLKNQEIVLYSSIGIVLYPEDGATPQELLKNADTAMYHAKRSGGNKYQFFSDSMNKQAVKRLQIENLIRHGLKEDFFSVFYQPKIEISTGKIAGMEALVRFETPTKGIISPGVFIPVSEETGQIIDIGEVVLRKACFATKEWISKGLFDGRIAVNLSAVQFTQPNLVDMISDILKESQLPAKHLELEITEGTVMDSPQKAIDTMLQIRAMGIHLSLDDFGTGYSSLAYLKRFPLNTLKIDKAFVDDIETSEQGRNMVATIVTIAHNLSLQVVAEGVETNNQLNFLAGLRCEQLQGYLYSKPLSQPHFESYLVSHDITDKSTAFGS